MGFTSVTNPSGMTELRCGNPWFPVSENDKNCTKRGGLFHMVISGDLVGFNDDLHGILWWLNMAFAVVS